MAYKGQFNWKPTYSITYITGYSAVFGSLYWLIQTGNWPLYLASFLWWAIACKLVFTTVGLHKYWAHGSFDTGPIGKFILTWGCIFCGTGSHYSWAIHHRHHHRTSDTKNDIHSPIANNKLETLFGLWIFKNREWWREKGVKTSHKDLLKDYWVRHIHRYYHYYWYALVGITALVDWRITLLFVLQPIGLNIVLHGLNNYISHTRLIPGNYTSFDTGDNSKNLPFWWGLLILGEGYHHNHHARPWDYDNAEKKGEWDVGGAIIRNFFEIHRGSRGSDYKKVHYESN